MFSCLKLSLILLNLKETKDHNNFHVLLITWFTTQFSCVQTHLLYSSACWKNMQVLLDFMVPNTHRHTHYHNRSEIDYEIADCTIANIISQNLVKFVLFVHISFSYLLVPYYLVTGSPDNQDRSYSILFNNLYWYLNRHKLYIIMLPKINSKTVTVHKNKFLRIYVQ